MAPYQMAVGGLTSYTVPKVGLQISATVRSQPAVQISGSIPSGPSGSNGATWLVPNTVVQSILGRIPSGGLPTGTTAVYLIDNGDHRLYADNRRTQIDMRFAKILRFGGRRGNVGVDLYNLLNTNYATAYESQYDFTVANGATWLNPTAILAPRFVRLNLTFDF